MLFSWAENDFLLLVRLNLCFSLPVIAATIERQDLIATYKSAYLSNSWGEVGGRDGRTEVLNRHKFTFNSLIPINYSNGLCQLFICEGPTSTPWFPHTYIRLSSPHLLLGNFYNQFLSIRSSCQLPSHVPHQTTSFLESNFLFLSLLFFINAMQT